VSLNIRLSAADINWLLNELQVLLETDASLPEALDLWVEAQSETAQHKLTHHIAKSVKQGESFSQALSLLNKHMPDFQRDYLDSWESRDELSEGLRRLLDYRESLDLTQTQFTQKIWGSLSYSLGLFVIMLLVVDLMQVFVLPVFNDMYTDFGAELPSLTLWAFDTLNGFNFIYILFGLVCILSVLVVLTLLGRSNSETILSYIPGVGKLYRDLAGIEALRTCALLADNQATLQQQISAIREIIRIKRYRAPLETAQDTIDNLPEALTQSQLFIPSHVASFKIAQKSNKISFLFNKLADLQSVRSAQKSKRYLATLSIMSLLFVGVLIGVVIIAMYLPIFSMGAVI
jgi:type IV pilus assembly protein PilC